MTPEQQITMMMPAPLYRRLKKSLSKNGMKLKAFVNSAVERKLQDEEKAAKRG